VETASIVTTLLEVCQTIIPVVEETTSTFEVLQQLPIQMGKSLLKETERTLVIGLFALIATTLELKYEPQVCCQGFKEELLVISTG
jgi:hypothetical protein